LGLKKFYYNFQQVKWQSHKFLVQYMVNLQRFSFFLNIFYKSFLSPSLNILQAFPNIKA